MKQDVKISVVIPVYNVEKYLCECIDSVLSQSYRNFEMILVDDGATDHSGEICDTYKYQDSRIRVIHQPNGGLSAARNMGLKNATGEYVYFLDSDDYIVPETFSKLMSVVQKNRADIVFFDADVFFTDCDPDPNVYKYERRKEYLSKNGREMLMELLSTDEYRTAVPLMIFKRKYLEDNSIAFLEGILHEDELFTFLVYFADGIVAHCHEMLYRRRMRAASIMTGASMLKRFKSMLVIYDTLENKYRKKEIYGPSADTYIARIVRSVIAKYKLLDEDHKRRYQSEYRSFERNVLRNRGYGDMKLKIKCSHGIRNWYYRAINKVNL